MPSLLHALDDTIVVEYGQFVACRSAFAKTTGEQRPGYGEHASTMDFL